MSYLWATRGRTWGFRFLRDGGFDSPLSVYEAAFAGLDDDQECWHRADGVVALRIQDPLGRHDAAGRAIPHEFVVFPPLADGIDTLEAGRAMLWPLVAQEFMQVWDNAQGPTPKE